MLAANQPLTSSHPLWSSLCFSERESTGLWEPRMGFLKVGVVRQGYLALSFDHGLLIISISVQSSLLLYSVEVN